MSKSWLKVSSNVPIYA